MRWGRSASWAANCQVSEARIDFSGSLSHTLTHIVDSTHAHSTEPGFEDGDGSVPFYSHDGGTVCVGGLVAYGGTESPSLLLETSHTRPTWQYGTIMGIHCACWACRNCRAAHSPL